MEQVGFHRIKFSVLGTWKTNLVKTIRNREAWVLQRTAEEGKSSHQDS